jgi:hypothetical protein
MQSASTGSASVNNPQWESSVFVFPIQAPGLMILDEYGAEDRNRFSSSGVLCGMALAHRYSHQERRDGSPPSPCTRPFKSESNKLPRVRWLMDSCDEPLVRTLPQPQ